MGKGQCTIITYHYVRDLQSSKYPKIKALTTDQFKNQLDYISRFYEFITVQDCIDAIYSNNDLPKNSVLLTFDDGYLDHYETVFPVLHEKKIQGCFFPSAKAISEKVVLGTNKVQFILSSVSSIEDLLDHIYSYLDEYRNQYNLRSNEFYFSEISLARIVDNKEIAFVKYLMQTALPLKLRELITDELFEKYVTKDESAFAQELYMDCKKIKEMMDNGMFIGCHGYEHHRMDMLTPKQQEDEIDMALDVLIDIGMSKENWIMCYQLGMYNDILITTIKEKGCKLAFTVRPDLAEISIDNAFKLERLDTIDLPNDRNAKPSKWTEKILVD